MSTLRALIADLRPSYGDQDYYVRFVTGCFVAASFFAVSAAFSFKEFSDYSGYQGREGNTFFYSDREAITGSAGQAYLAIVFAGISLIAGIVVIAWKWRMELVTAARTFGSIVIVSAVGGAFAGLLGSGMVQLVFGAIASRTVFWGVLPLLGVGAVVGVLMYAKEGEGTIMDAM